MPCLAPAIVDDLDALVVVVDEMREDVDVAVVTNRRSSAMRRVLRHEVTVLGRRTGDARTAEEVAASLTPSPHRCLLVALAAGSRWSLATLDVDGTVSAGPPVPCAPSEPSDEPIELMTAVQERWRTQPSVLVLAEPEDAPFLRRRLDPRIEVADTLPDPVPEGTCVLDATVPPSSGPIRHPLRFDGRAAGYTLLAQGAGTSVGSKAGTLIAVVDVLAHPDAHFSGPGILVFPLGGAVVGFEVGAPIGAALSSRRRRWVPATGALVGIGVQGGLWTLGIATLLLTEYTDTATAGAITGTSLLVLGAAAPSVGAGLAQGTWGVSTPTVRFHW
ncbi:MAG: hypothetical protein H6738_22875 [Alphaproteobacteria bacterium]|nr:hypothetical protein [Alphaproteobacteria bacterium]MCB9699647.1 hypothetical protein [Alphaproteobacteria bacterium]